MHVTFLPFFDGDDAVCNHVIPSTFYSEETSCDEAHAGHRRHEGPESQPHLQPHPQQQQQQDLAAQDWQDLRQLLMPSRPPARGVPMKPSTYMMALGVAKKVKQARKARKAAAAATAAPVTTSSVGYSLTGFLIPRTLHHLTQW